MEEKDTHPNPPHLVRHRTPRHSKSKYRIDVPVILTITAALFSAFAGGMAVWYPWHKDRQEAANKHKHDLAISYFLGCYLAQNVVDENWDHENYESYAKNKQRFTEPDGPQSRQEVRALLQELGLNPDINPDLTSGTEETDNKMQVKYDTIRTPILALSEPGLIDAFTVGFQVTYYRLALNSPIGVGDSSADEEYKDVLPLLTASAKRFFADKPLPKAPTYSPNQVVVPEGQTFDYFAPWPEDPNLKSAVNALESWQGELETRLFGEPETVHAPDSPFKPDARGLLTPDS